MVTETKDRKINTEAHIENDGVKRLPHERDESPDGQDVEPRGIIKQAADDLARGLVDTDLHGTRGIEEAVTAPAEPGQAHPLPDAHEGMRDHDAAPPSGDKQ
ncbi:hypothetical protein [Massilia glaciei]|uniref:Uncharacterized protein n=1 Tax=Massilia glaciei TaxID=1524097 RepID=A0A2U2HDS8_9BURK|nr:hypothetical protein [Massilia glaciei]PWF41329.1 hypothetical protein C7C56_024890 [Massilia glaciei]